jgi:hypothetical protein
VLEQRKPCAAVGSRLRIAVPKLKGDDWLLIAQATFDLAEVVDTGATQDAESRAWLTDYFAAKTVATIDDRDREAFAEVLADDLRVEAIRGSERLYLNLPSLITWVNVRYRLRLTTAQMSARLVRLGFDKRRETARRVYGSQVRRVLWHSPVGFRLDDAQASDDE